jgi:hypothetical protein
LIGVSVSTAEASNPPSGLPVVITLGLQDGRGLSELLSAPSAVVQAAASAMDAASTATAGIGLG